MTASALNTRRLTRLALLCALALCLQYVENLLPYLIPALPIHVGFANIAVLYTLLSEGRRAACAVAAVRCLCFAFIMGRPEALLYSSVGTLLSLAAMCLVLPLAKQKLTLYGVSVLGAFMFNAGQTLAACLVIGRAMLIYAPWFGLMSVFCGLVTAFLCLLVQRVVKPYRTGEPR